MRRASRLITIMLLAVVSVATPASPGQAAHPLLRLMPFGDSITFGLGHPQYNSYRVRLQMDLRASGIRLDMVGSRASGWAGYDRNNEGHSGWTIAGLQTQCDRWVAAAQPNVVLLHAGTNDMRATYHISPRTAAGRLGRLIQCIQARAGYVHIFVATIIQNGDPAMNARIQQYNALIPGVVARAGVRVHLVPLAWLGRWYERADQDHPNVLGYRRMAFGWYREMRRYLPDVGDWKNINWPV